MDVIWWVTAAIGAIAGNLIASELFAWGPRLSERLMCGAVRRLAPEMQERMREEWAGHLQTIPPGLWRIVAAAGFYVATHQINMALRVWERQENPEEKTLQEKASGKIEGTILNVNVDFLDAKYGMAEAMDTLSGGPEPLYSRTPHRLDVPIKALVAWWGRDWRLSGRHRAPRFAPRARWRGTR
jgi:hypothetical protein